MTDWEDLEETAWVGSMVSSGPIALVFFVVLLCVFAFFTYKQDNDCGKKRCEFPAHTQVIKGECVCLAPARD